MALLVFRCVEVGNEAVSSSSKQHFTCPENPISVTMSSFLKFDVILQTFTQTALVAVGGHVKGQFYNIMGLKESFYEGIKAFRAVKSSEVTATQLADNWCVLFRGLHKQQRSYWLSTSLEF